MNGKRYEKTSAGMEALGRLDELNSLLGVVRSQKISATHKKIVRAVQEDLFTVQAIVYFCMTDKPSEAPVLPESKITDLEKIIDAAERTVKPERGFIIVGDTPEGAWFDYARAVSRTAERAVLTLAKEKMICAEVFAYMNRLSSLFFALARLSAKSARKKEAHPKYK